MAAHKANKPTKTKPDPEDVLTPEVQGSEQEHARFLKLALAIPPALLMPFRADASLAYHNAKSGVEAVMAHEKELHTMLPHEDLARLEELPNVVLGLLFAVLKADGTAPEPKTVREDLAAAYKLRRLLLTGFGALKEAGHFTQKEYDTIAAGRGARDAVNDCIALAAKYREKWSTIRGKTAVTAADVRRAADLGSKLQGAFKSDRTPRKKGKTGDAAQAAEVRDRFWTLTSQIHDRLWRVGALLFGRAVDAHVPGLQATRLVGSEERRAAKAQKAAAMASEKAKKAADRVAAKAQRAAEKKKGKKAPG